MKQTRMVVRVAAGMFMAGALIGAMAGCTGVAGPVGDPTPVYPASAVVPYGQAAPNVPRQPVATPYSGMCYAGVFYTCRLPNSLPIGTRCSCPGIGAPSYGTVR